MMKVCRRLLLLLFCWNVNEKERFGYFLCFDGAVAMKKVEFMRVIRKRPVVIFLKFFFYF